METGTCPRSHFKSYSSALLSFSSFHGSFKRFSGEKRGGVKDGGRQGEVDYYDNSRIESVPWLCFDFNPADFSCKPATPEHVKYSARRQEGLHLRHG